MRKRYFYLSLLLIGLINLFLRLVFAFYGYIAVEEGTLIYNQQLAYHGLLPFIHYDAWNSLFSDYLIGWYQLFITPSILIQRFFGILLSFLAFLLTIYISRAFKDKTLVLLTAVFLTFGSYFYLYLSTIPYSEQTMTFFIMLALFFLSKCFTDHRNKFFHQVLSVIFITLAAAVKIQAAPAALILWFFVIFIYQKNLKEKLITSALTALVATLIHLPFFLAGIDNLVYSYTWPFWADKILIYQQNAAGLHINSAFSLLQGLFQNYQIFFILIPSALAAYIWQRQRIRGGNKQQYLFIILLTLMSTGFIFIGIIHKPPYSSYIYPAVPVLSLIAALLINQLLINWPKANIFIYGLIIMLLFSNFLLFPHYKFVKTSWRRSLTTPHQHLAQISRYIQQITADDEEVISFYMPLTVAINRKIPAGINRGRFSLTKLPTTQARKYHLTNPDMLSAYIKARKAAAIIFTDMDMQFFGKNEQQRKQILKELENNYILSKTFSQIREIENPRIKNLFVYKRKNED